MILDLLSLLGSLALFLYGMKIMSEGLEKFAGDRLRNILAMMTRNRMMGVLTGIIVTTVIQSSSATTVMVVSFVNAGLMSLVQAIGVIMGANIGTTVTAWIISAVGFKVNISAFAIPLMAIGMPLIFSNIGKKKSIGEFIFGFAFLFMGLSFLQHAAEALNIGTIVANMLKHVSGDSIWIMIIFVCVGALVTMLVQASAATMAITLMLFDMQIPGFGFHQAAALAMGQNIGTTITALMASLTGNTLARRAALAHTFFNVFGVLVVLAIFYPFCNGVTWVVDNILHASHNDLFLLSAFHTAFNVFNTLLLIGFVTQIERLICKVLPLKESDKQDKGLQFISGGLLSTSELSIMAAKNEIGVFAERLLRMMKMVEKLLVTKKPEEFAEIYSKISKYEQITDNMEIEIANYLSHVSEGRLSDESKVKIMHMLRIVDELESIGDSMYHLGRTLERKRELKNMDYTDKQTEQINEMLRVTNKALQEMRSALDKDPKDIDIKKHFETENELNELRTEFKAQNLQAINNHEYDYQLGVFYVDFICECEKIGDYVINVLQALQGN
jgi:phosphate:Na+ symporter